MTTITRARPWVVVSVGLGLVLTSVAALSGPDTQRLPDHREGFASISEEDLRRFEQEAEGTLGAPQSRSITFTKLAFGGGWNTTTVLTRAEKERAPTFSQPGGAPFFPSPLSPGALAPLVAPPHVPP